MYFFSCQPKTALSVKIHAVGYKSASVGGNSRMILTWGTPYISPLPTLHPPPSQSISYNRHLHLPPFHLTVVCRLPRTSFCPQEVPSRRLLSRHFILSTTPLVSSFGAHCSVAIKQCSYYRRRPLGIQAPPERDFGVTE